MAGEAVFILPFVLTRVFRPTVLEVFKLSNYELGTAQSMYGIVAIIAYFLGGPLADKYQPRKLIALALWTTALGGLLYSTYPTLLVLKILYGYWGFTTIFFLWAAMIKATRIWGGENSQGKAFGFLDGGRGLVGALFGLLGVIIFSLLVTEAIEIASFTERQRSFQFVILISSILVALIGVFVWFFLKTDSDNSQTTLEKITLQDLKRVLNIPSVWLLMVIILCAYVGYKTTGVFSQYAKEIMFYDEIESAKVGTFLLFIRPIVGVSIGFLADKSKVTYWLIISFVLSSFGSLLFATGSITPSASSLFFLSTLIIATGIYAARSLYFAVMKEGRIPLTLTGTAVGLISLIGYTPDIFTGLSIGFLLDNSPGKLGHQHVFLMLSIFSFIGLFASLLFLKVSKK